jgi:hypothetical protein
MGPIGTVKRNATAGGIFTMNRSQYRIDIMEAYNPERVPEPESWLELDEQERILLIETWHRVARIKLPTSRHMPRCM